MSEDIVEVAKMSEDIVEVAKMSTNERTQPFLFVLIYNQNNTK